MIYWLGISRSLTRQSNGQVQLARFRFASHFSQQYLAAYCGVIRFLRMEPLNQLLLRTIVFTSLVFLLNSCSLPSKFEVYNNTGSPIKILMEKGDYVEHYDISTNTSLVIDYWELPYGVAVEIKAKNSTWLYTPRYISHSFGEDFIFSHYLFKLQVESNGQIFVVSPESALPQEEHVKQPEGYPLTPQSKNV